MLTHWTLLEYWATQQPVFVEYSVRRLSDFLRAATKPDTQRQTS